MENVLSHYQFFKSHKVAAMSNSSSPADALYFDEQQAQTSKQEQVMYRVSDGEISEIDMTTKEVTHCTRPATMKKRPHCCKSMMHNGKIYCFVANMIFIYDMQEREWEQVTSDTVFPTEAAIIKRFNPKIQETTFVFYGGLAQTMKNTLLEYRPSTHAVTEIGKHPKIQGVIGMAYSYRAYNDSLVTHGGYMVSNSNQFFWQYHFPSQTWSIIPELNPYNEQYESGMMLDAHQFFVLGGLLNGSCSTGKVYDFRSKYWRKWRSNIYFVAGVNMPACVLSKQQKSVVLYVGSAMFSIQVNMLEREPLEQELWKRSKQLCDVTVVLCK